MKLMRQLLTIVFILFVVFAQVMIVFQVVRPVCQPGWYVDIPHKKRNVMDFFQYVQVAQLALQGSHQVYDPDVQLAWHNNLIKPLKWENDLVFYNQQPPSSYFLLIPLAFAPNYGVGYCLWGLLQSAAGLAAMHFLSSFGKLNKRDRKIFLLAVFCSFPAYSCIWQGNTSFWLLSCLGFYAYFWLKGRDVLGGLFLALSTFKPQYTLMMSLPSLVSMRWKLIATAAVIEVLLLIAGGMIIGFENVINYPHVIANAESNVRFTGVRPEAMVSLRGIFSHLGMGIHDSLSISSTIMILSLVPVCLFWHLVNSKIGAANTALKAPGLQSTELKCWALAMTIVLALTLSPHSHSFDCVLLAFPAALTLSTISLVDALKIKDRSLCCWSVTFIVYPILTWILNFSMPLMTSPIFLFLLNVILLISGSFYTVGLMRRGFATGTDPTGTDPLSQLKQATEPSEPAAVNPAAGSAGVPPASTETVDLNPAPETGGVITTADAGDVDPVAETGEVISTAGTVDMHREL